MKSKVKYLIPATILALMMGLIVGTVAALPGPYEPQTGFEIEGNIDFDGWDGAQYDWWNAETHHPDYPPAILIADAHSKNENDDYFSPSGKFDDPAGWSIKEGSVGPGQNELTNVFVWAVAPYELSESQEDSWLIMGMERVKKSGTFALDFEFNQDPWILDPLPQVGGPNRTEGDIAVGFELKGNPTSATEDLQVLIVQFYDLDDFEVPMLCSNTIGNGNKLLAVGVGTDECLPYGETGWYYRFLDNAAILASSGLGMATMNPEGEGFSQNSFTPNGETYTSYDPQGKVDNYVGEFELAEAAINLTALGIEPGCPGFGSVHAKSRSSLEVGSDLKDLAGPRSLPVKCYIEGYKYLDVNGNGDRDLGEPGLNGWTINLSDGSSAITANDANGDPGYYRFDNLSNGSYTASEVCTGQGAGWVQTEPYLAGDPPCGDGVQSFTINIDNRVGVGDFGNGQPAIDVTKACTSVVEVGGTITYDFTTTNTGNVYLEGVTLTDNDIVYYPTIGQMAPQTSDTRSTTRTAPSTAQEFTNTVTASGNFGGSTVFATVSDTDTCVTTVVDARLGIKEDATNEVGDPHTFYVKLEKNAGTGWVAADGETVSVAFVSTGADEQDPNPASCTTNSSGECSVTVNSQNAGTIVASASATLTVGGVSLDRNSSNEITGYFDDATKTYVDGSIAWQKQDDRGNPLGGATFEACRTFDRFGTDIADECQTVTDPDGFFLLTGLKLGTWTVKETEPPAGFSGDSHVETVYLTLAEPDATIEYIWINIPNLGCTPGFWNGGNGSLLWDEVNDPDWFAKELATNPNPYTWTTPFNEFFDLARVGAVDPSLTGTMWDYVSGGGGSIWAEKAARDMVAAYLNESAFTAYPALGLQELLDMWYAAVAAGEAGYIEFHNLVGGWNSPEPPGYCPIGSAP